MDSDPTELEISPLRTRPNLRIQVPGSKSLTNRALVLAALTKPGLTLNGALQSEDTEVMIDCLRRLGWQVEPDWKSRSISVASPNQVAPQAELFVGNSGTTIRFLTAMLALGHGDYLLDGVPRMRERPIQDLLDALNQIGAEARSGNEDRCPPVVLKAHGWSGGKVRVRADISSQYLSGLLLAAPFGAGVTEITLEGELVSEPYIEMTLAILKEFGLVVERPQPGVYRVPGNQSSQRAAQGTYTIEPDASSASYFFAAAAISGGTVTVEHLNARSLQGDVHFVDLLERMGCVVERGAEEIQVTGRPLRGIDVDMNAISDTVMTLAAVACFADGPTHLRNVAHIRHKETDRIAAIAAELRKLGATVEERADGLTITPTELRGCSVETYQDHRMAMSLALVGLKVPGVKVKNPGCVAKTYPGFWQDFAKLN